jgi:hypothetical protein
MARKAIPSAEQRRTDQAAADGPEAQAASGDEVLQRVRRLLEAGQPKQALEAIGQAPAKSLWLLNAAAVCQLRLGHPEKAVELLRPLVVQGGIHLRGDVPPAFKLTFAAALLTTGNLDGFLATLNEVRAEEHPAVGQYREAYRRWKASLTAWERLKVAFGGQPARPFVLDFPPGEVT